MSNNENKKIEESSKEDVVEQVLDVLPPEEDKVAKKKSMPKGIKVLFGIGGLGILFLIAYQMSLPPVQTTAQINGSVGVKINEGASINTGKASDKPTNPEAIEINKKVEQEKANEILKDPNKSYMTVPPFGDGENNGNVPGKENNNNGNAGLTPLPPAPPPENVGPEMVKPVNNANGQQQEDPALLYARKLYAQTTFSVKASYAPGNVEPSTVNASSNAASNNTGLLSENNKIQDSDVGAGDISYAILTTSLNSAIPQTPARAIIHGGKLNNGVLLGMIENVNDRYLVLKFTTLTLNKKTYPISGIAINPDAQDAGIVDKVNDRTWTRTALQAGVGFVQAIGAAKLQEGTSTTTNAQTGSTTTQVANRSNQDLAFIGLGGAAQAAKPTVDQEINKIKSEVIVNQGKEIGVIFLQPVYLQ